MPDPGGEHGDAVPARPLSAVKCLLVEEDSEIARADELALGDVGAHVTIVDASGAKDALSREPWHLVLISLLREGDVAESIGEACWSTSPLPAVVVVAGTEDSGRLIRLQALAVVIDEAQRHHHLVDACSAALARASRSYPPAGAPHGQNDLSGPGLEVAADLFARAHGLSPRQAAILCASMGNLSNKEIASQFGLSEGTVRTHWLRMSKKVRCHGGGKESLLKELVKFVSTHFEPAGGTGGTTDQGESTARRFL